MFRHANNTHVSGAASFAHNENHYHFDSGTVSSDDGIQALAARVVKGAMHNSGERFDAPTCHPETRTAIQDDILGWADELVNDCNELVTWLYGPAGAGKSAIAQTIAEKLHARGQLTASFFFSRASGSVGRGRGVETDLVATLAYQLSLSVPATKQHIATVVQEDPLIFDLSLKDQVYALIVAPLAAVSRLSGSERPRVILVDGLDECRKKNDAQKRIVDALISGLRQVPRCSHKLFITSRPESRIMETFEMYKGKLLRIMELDNTWDPARDIWTFLNASFADIRRSHFYFRNHAVDESWPGPYAIKTLVNRSSGQFIYASVIIKYIKSDENYNPVARLDTILSLNNGPDHPYTELDALYKFAFSQIQDVDRLRVLTVLSLDQEYDRLALDLQTKQPLHTFLSEFMGVHHDEIKFYLLPLVSFLGWIESGPRAIHYIHASLPDFLNDQTRSSGFCIKGPTTAAGVVHRAIALFEDGRALQAPHCIPILMKIPQYYTKMLPSDQKFHIYLQVNSFNIVETVLGKLDVDFVESHELALHFNDYLTWVLEESKDKNALHYLSKSVAQIQTWLVNQFEHLQTNGFQDTEQSDLRLFFTRYNKSSQLSEVFSAALEICESSPVCHQLQFGSMLESSHQTGILCYLLSYSLEWSGLYSWFFRFDLFGCYAMTRKHYEVALRRIIHYLLQLPKHVLLAILSGCNKDIFETPTIRLIYRVLNSFFRRSPPAMDLYFLVALAYPITQNIGGHNALTYLHKARRDFPFLKKPGSRDYILAKAKVEETCNNLKIKSSILELLEMKIIDRQCLDLWQLVGYNELLGLLALVDRRISDSVLD